MHSICIGVWHHKNTPIVSLEERSTHSSKYSSWKYNSSILVLNNVINILVESSKSPITHRNPYLFVFILLAFSIIYFTPQHYFDQYLSKFLGKKDKKFLHQEPIQETTIDTDIEIDDNITIDEQEDQELEQEQNQEQLSEQK